MPDRLSPSREQEIRDAWVWTDPDHTVRELFAELDARQADLASAQQQIADLTTRFNQTALAECEATLAAIRAWAESPMHGSSSRSQVSWQLWASASHEIKSQVKALLASAPAEKENK